MSGVAPWVQVLDTWRDQLEPFHALFCGWEVFSYVMGSLDPDMRDPYGNGPGHAAGDAAVLKHLIQVCPEVLSVTNDAGQTVLHAWALAARTDRKGSRHTDALLEVLGASRQAWRVDPLAADASGTTAVDLLGAWPLRPLYPDLAELRPPPVPKVPLLRQARMANLDTMPPETIGTVALADQVLSEVPERVTELPNLETLYLHLAPGTELPVALGDLPSLCTVVIHGGPVRWTPGSLERLSTLGSLRMAVDAEGLPDDLSGLSALECLDLSRSELTHLPDSLGSLHALRTLSLAFAPVRDLPAPVALLSALERVDLSRCELQDLPEETRAWVALRHLNLAWNPMHALPRALAHWKQLETLHLDGLPLHELPAELAGLGALTTLTLARVGLDLAAQRSRLPPHLADALMPRPPYANPHAKGPARVSAAPYLASRRPGVGAGMQEIAAELLVDHGIASDVEFLVRDYEHGDHRPGEDWIRMRGAVQATALHAVALTATPAAGHPPTGSTRLGGWPDAGPDDPAEDSLPLVAQLDLEELAPLQSYLPRTGWLQILARIDDDDGVVGRVVHQTSLAGPREVPGGEPLFAVHQVHADACVALPYFVHDDWLPASGTARELLGLDRAADADDPEGVGWLVGAPDGTAHVMNGYVYGADGPPQVRAARQYGGEPVDWVVLLSLDLHDLGRTHGPRWLWCAVHRADLARRAFEQVVFGLDRGQAGSISP